MTGISPQFRLYCGPEMTSSTFTQWCEEKEIEIIYIQPGKPTQNAYIERFNRTFRTGLLAANLFHTPEQVREITWAWMISYNGERPHAALGNIPPTDFKQLVTAEISSNRLCA